MKRIRKFGNPVRLVAWQRRRLKSLLETVHRLSPFYRRLDLSDFASLPVLNRETYVTEFDRLNTRGGSRAEILRQCLEAERNGVRAPNAGGCVTGLSSGTSEGRGIFMISAPELTRYTAHLLGKVLPGSLFSHHRIGYFIRADAELYDSARGKRLQFRHFDLRRTTEEQAAALEKFSPTTLFAPPSVLRKLGALHRAGKLVMPALGHLLTGAEVLDPLDRFHIERDFGIVPAEIYQCTEGFVGYTCAAGSWHLNEDLLIVERDYLDSDRRRFAPIITDLYRTVQPHVRYRISDVLLELASGRETRCPCGRGLSKFAAVTGRESDLPRFPRSDSKGETVFFHDEIQSLFYAFRERLDAYQFVQTGPADVVVLIRVVDGVAPESLAEPVRHAFSLLCEAKGCRPPVLRFGDYVEAAAPAKLRRIRREIR